MKRLVFAALAVCVTLSASACGSSFDGVYNTPLPGGADLGDHPYRVIVHFSDVMDLVPQAGVKVDDAAVGRVDKIEPDRGGREAKVTLAVNGSVRLPENAGATIKQSSLLGEKFVALTSPARATGRLTDGATIPVSRTDTGAGVEEVLGALSLLLNGGGLTQVRDITQELNKVSTGKEQDVRAFLGTVAAVTKQLNGRRDSIVKALDGIDRLSKTLRQNRTKISGALTDLTPGISALAQQRKDLTSMVTALDRLSGVAVDTVNKSKDQLVADLKALEPTLKQLNVVGDKLPKSLELLLTYPFPDSALAGIKGDFLNVYLKTNLSTPGGIEVGPGKEYTPPKEPDLSSAPTTTTPPLLLPQAGDR